MKAVTWQGFRDVSMEEVADPIIKEPNDAIIKVTSTNICGSDLHLYETMGAFMSPGDVLGHEAMGIVLELVGISARFVPAIESSCRSRSPVDTAGCVNARFTHSVRRLRCEVKAAVPHCSATRSCTAKCPAAKPNTYGCRRRNSPTSWYRTGHRTIASSICPMSCPPLGRRWSTQLSQTVARCSSWVWGRSATWPAGIAQQKWIDTIIAVDLVDARLERARSRGIQVIDLREHEDDLPDVVRELTDGRGPDSVIDAVGMEAHGSPGAAIAQRVAAHLPDAVPEPLMKRAGLDRLAALYTAIETVRRGGTVSLSGVYGGMADPLPMMSLFDKQIQLRMGQANVKRWIPDIMPFLTEEDPLGVEEFATHRLPLGEAPAAYEMFQQKAHGAVKIMLKPWPEPAMII